MKGRRGAGSVEILLVEDNPGDVRLTREALRAGSVATHLSVASDGARAVAFLRESGASRRRPDLILLDLNLPGMNGWEVLSEIKRDPRLQRIPVVVLTSSDAEGDVGRAYDLGANAYVRKPAGFDALVDAMRAIEAFWLEAVTLPPTAP